jgi:hypothetical protein
MELDTKRRGQVNREQISIVHSVGKTVEAVIFSKWRQMMLLAFSGNEFAIVKAQEQGYDEDAEIDHDVSDVLFDHYDYSEEDLEKVFGADTVIQWKADDAKRELEVRQQMEDRRRAEYERLKAEFEGTK